MGLTKIIAAHRLDSSCGWREGVGGFRAWCSCGAHGDILPDTEVQYRKESEVGLAWHAAHVAAAIREARTIRTPEEAMALPAGSIIIDAENDTMKHYGGDHWCEPGNSDCWNVRYFEYPIRVLYRPDDEGEQ